VPKIKRKPLKVMAASIYGKVDGNILAGSSVLNDPDQFVWGGP